MTIKQYCEGCWYFSVDKIKCYNENLPYKLLKDYNKKIVACKISNERKVPKGRAVSNGQIIGGYISIKT